ncbi:Ribonuclease D [Alphaproteobacteria bacterium]
MVIHYHTGDLPESLVFSGSIAIDTEAMGLNNARDRLCVVQISEGNGDAHLLHLVDRGFDCPNLKKILSDHNKLKIFHFARFDVAILQHSLAIDISNIYCTKIASKLARTFTEHQGLRDLCHDLLGIKISKQQQTSDWGQQKLTQEQIEYAANDVLYLHKLKNVLDKLLVREGREEIAKKCFDFLPTLARLDVFGWGIQLFEH